MKTTIKLIILFLFVQPPLLYCETISFYYKDNYRNLKFITVYINDVPVEMIFDTGASDILLTSSSFNAIGGSRYLGSGLADTPGGKMPFRVYQVRSVRLGKYELRNIQISVSSSSNMNLLGGDFLKHFNYYINESAKTITLEPLSQVPIINNPSADIKTPSVGTLKKQDGRLFDRDVIENKKRVIIRYPDGSLEYEFR